MAGYIKVKDLVHGKYSTNNMKIKKTDGKEYVYSINGIDYALFECDEDVTNVQQAEIAARKLMQALELTHIHISEKADVTIEDTIPDYLSFVVIEEIRNYVRDHAGVVAEDYLKDLPREAKETLNVALRDCVKNWLETNKVKPTWCMLKNEKMLDI